jgi:hypothetical protein
MDHTHCFTCGRDLNQHLADISRVKDALLYGLAGSKCASFNTIEFVQRQFFLLRIFEWMTLFPNLHCHTSTSVGPPAAATFCSSHSPYV